MCLRMNSPATNRVGNGGCPGPARQTEPNRPARKPQSISAASRTSGWRRLMILSRAGRNKSSWRSSRGWLIATLTANLAVEGITNRPNPESRNARKQQPTTSFLANSNTCSGQITAMVQSLPNSSRTTRESNCKPTLSERRSQVHGISQALTTLRWPPSRATARHRRSVPGHPMPLRSGAPHSTSPCARSAKTSQP